MTSEIRLAVDVCIGKKATRRLEQRGCRVVVRAEHAEPDRDWFARGLAAKVDAFVTHDSDISILGYDANVPVVLVKRQGVGGANFADLVLAKLPRVLRWHR